MARQPKKRDRKERAETVSTHTIGRTARSMTVISSYAAASMMQRANTVNSVNFSLTMLVAHI